jgi:hypothetical protein
LMVFIVATIIIAATITTDTRVRVALISATTLRGRS